MKTNGEASRFQDYLAVGNIVCHTAATTCEAVVRELVEHLADYRAGLEPEALINAVMAREAVGATVIAPGLGMPHARFNHLDQPLVALATSKTGISFGPAADLSVRVVVLVLSPSAQPGLHLQILAALAREFRTAGRIEALADLGRPSEVMNFFAGTPMPLPDYLTVRDLVRTDVPTLLEQDTLGSAIGKFAATGASQMAVLDDDGDLRGVIDLTDILRYSLPEHIMWMDDLSPIYNFQPFADMLANSGETKVSDIMREEFVQVDENVPAVQLAKLFLTHRLRELIVVKAERKLAGVVELRDFCAKLFWE